MTTPPNIPSPMLAALREHGCIEIRRLSPGSAVMPGETVEQCSSHHAVYSGIAWKPVGGAKKIEGHL